jgi:hypothetical protein
MSYIHNLRSIGCPQQTIRDIIVADVNQLYAHRREQEIRPPELEWWKSDADSGVIATNAVKLKALDAEKQALLDRLLGKGWELAGSPPEPVEQAGIRLTGPLLGNLNSTNKQRVYEIAGRAEQQMKQLLQNSQNGVVDPKQLLRIRQQSRAELAKALTPEQLQEFLLRYSDTAKKMREELHGVTLTPEEFRNLFRARDSIEGQLMQYSASADQQSLQMQQALQRQSEDLLRTTLGPDRYAAYRVGQDPLYRQAQTTIQQAGASAAALAPLYQINQATEAELARIRLDNSLTTEQKNEAMIEAQAEREKSLQQLLGGEAYQRLQDQQALNSGVGVGAGAATGSP